MGLRRAESSRMSKLLDFYFAQGWHLIRILPSAKVPCDKAWQLPENKLTPERAQFWTLLGGNLAVVCGKQSSDLQGHGLLALDFDARPALTPDVIEQFRAYKTLVMFTPRGYRLFYLTDNPNKVAITGRKLDVKKWSGGYTLIPPSRVLQKDGSLKSYWWLDKPQTPKVI